MNYQEAIRARFENASVVVSGDLQPRLNLEMTSISEFRVVESDSEDEGF